MATSRLEDRPSSVAHLAALVRRARVPLALVVLALVTLNRVSLMQVDVGRDVQYLLWGWLPGGGGTLELPHEAPWLVLPVVALVLFVARPAWWSWALVVVTYVLPHFWPYRIGQMQLWGVRITEVGTPEVVQLLHVPLVLLLGILVVLVVGRRAGPTVTRRPRSDADVDAGAVPHPVDDGA